MRKDSIAIVLLFFVFFVSFVVDRCVLKTPLTTKCTKDTKVGNAVEALFFVRFVCFVVNRGAFKNI